MARRFTAALLLARASSLATPPQRVALVTGSSRGIGKGIAVELGRGGFAVYAVGRSSRSGRKNSQAKERTLPPGSDLTVEATAEAITAAGGRGLALQCDVGDEADLARVLTAVLEAEGRLDVLVCSAYSTPPGALRDDFWKQGLSMWDAVNNVGLRSVYATCCAATPLLIETAARAEAAGSSGAGSAAPPPLICLVSSFGGKSYTFNVAYGVGKAAVDRLAQDMSVQVSSATNSEIEHTRTVLRTRWGAARRWHSRPSNCGRTCAQADVFVAQP
jgi:dehydrogenase/reductase SDR family protein 1